MTAQDTSPCLKGLGLVGDGDEIDALQAVERVFGVAFDKSSYPALERCETAGDWFDLLLTILPADRRDDPANWQRFSEAICSDTGDDANQVCRETVLIGGGTPVNGWVAVLVILIVAGLFFVVGWVIHIA